mgnify:FL=1
MYDRSKLSPQGNAVLDLAILHGAAARREPSVTITVTANGDEAQTDTIRLRPDVYVALSQAFRRAHGAPVLALQGVPSIEGTEFLPVRALPAPSTLSAPSA